VVEYLSRQPKSLLAALGVLLVVLVGFSDYISRPEIGFSIFYLLPISLATWFIGMQTGLLISFTSAATWLALDLTKTGRYSHTFIPYWNSLIHLGFFLVIVLLQNALKKEQLCDRIDPLTEVGNRRQFFEVAQSEIDRARRYHHPFTVAYMDIDNFKNVNDSLGHDAGDALLRAIARTLKKDLRSTDSVARLGGDEFALFLPETETESARHAIDKLQGKLFDVIGKSTWPVTFSFGVMTFISPPNSIDDMIKKVDGLMYLSKKSGKNMITYDISDKLVN
jgi:diguanylate cyclase (GGDEF)-like protein